MAIAVVFALLGAFLIGVVIDLQTVRPDRYRSLGEDQRTRTRSVAAFRGSLTDRNGFVFAASTPSLDLIADPLSVVDASATAHMLGPILGMDAATVRALLVPEHAGDRYSMVFETVPEDAVLAIRAVNQDEDTTKLLRGLVLKPQEERLYPGGDLAAPIIGRIDGESTGRSGLERHFNEILTGIPGREQVERSGFGLISVGKHQFEPAAQGYNIELTLDHRLQFVAEAALMNECQRLGAKGATAVVTVPQTGEILVMANVERREDGTCGVGGYNAAAMDSFEPGSVIKPLTAAAAVEEFGFDAETEMFVPDLIRVSDKTFVDHPRHQPGNFTLSEIMAQSMNVGVIQLGNQLGASRFHQYATNFGLGSRTGADIGAESAGLLRAPEEWQGSDAGSIVIGQGLTVTTMQLAGAYGALANQGSLVTPTLIRSISNAAGEQQEMAVRSPRSVVTSETAAEVTKILSAVVHEGTGEKARVPGYVVAGKTGTAWKVFDNGSGQLTYGSTGDRRYVTTFAGYAPAEDPRLSVVVVIDEPRTATSASTAAAPVWGEITGYALRILEVPPSPTTDRALTLTKVRGTPAPAPEASLDPNGILTPGEEIVETPLAEAPPAPDLAVPAEPAAAAPLTESAAPAGQP